MAVDEPSSKTVRTISSVVAYTGRDNKMTDMKTKFYELLSKRGNTPNSFILTRDQYRSLLQDVKRLKATNRTESNRDYRISQRYDVLSISGCQKLVQRMTDDDPSVRLYVPLEDVFDILYETHLKIGHVGRDRMKREVNKRYKNVTRRQINTFLKLCRACANKKRIERCALSAKLLKSEVEKCEDNATNVSSGELHLSSLVKADMDEGCEFTEEPPDLYYPPITIDHIKTEVSSDDYIIPSKRRRVAYDVEHSDDIESVQEANEARDEFFYFGKNVSCQLRQLPLHRALLCQSKILELLMTQRVEALNEV